ncbi:hypothetical protein BLNAU_3258 [Blattamonas nauphoetae]|uniref:Uncharacterized protein n=1 Tax=Blattamonas nauphoetae TaxID=2049346 RepID=A0ABQ9YDU6_9EUKA|nr:hypothetical protein BLNAU_3258 [Blattamonas nauphoetae]
MRQFVEQVETTQVRQEFEEMTRKLRNPVPSRRKCVQFSKLRHKRGTEVSWFDASNKRSRAQRTAPGCVPVPWIHESKRQLYFWGHRRISWERRQFVV